MRVAAYVDRESLTECVEKAQNCANQKDFFIKVTNIYNKVNRVNLTPAIISSRIKEFKLSKYLPAAKRGRQTIVVDAKLLQSVITELEENEKFENRSDLFEKVAEKYNEKAKNRITPSVVYLRVKEFDLILKTPKGKRGRAAGFGGPRGPRTTRQEKFKNNPKAQESFAAMRKRTPERFLPIVDRIENGSLKAAVKLNCLNCTAYQTVEIKHCASTACPLYNFRPYQNTKVEEIDSAEEETEENEDENSEE